MAYKWKDGEVITAEKLNNTGNVMVVNDNDNTLDHTWQEIFDVINTGGFVYIRRFEEGTSSYIISPVIRIYDYNVEVTGHRNDFYTALAADDYPRMPDE